MNDHDTPHPWLNGAFDDDDLPPPGAKDRVRALVVASLQLPPPPSDIPDAVAPSPMRPSGGASPASGGGSGGQAAISGAAKWALMASTVVVVAGVMLWPSAKPPAAVASAVVAPVAAPITAPAVAVPHGAGFSAALSAAALQSASDVQVPTEMASSIQTTPPVARTTSKARRTSTPAVAASASTDVDISPEGAADAAVGAAQRASDTLSQERALLETARRALLAGNVAYALSHVAAYARAFPQGQLLQEGQALHIQALLKGGDVASAKTKLREFVAAHPDSLFRQGLEAAVNSAAHAHTH